MTQRILATVHDLKVANAASGRYFFSPDTMRFFASRVLSQVFPTADGGAYFVTSEKAGFTDPTRVYTVRRMHPDGDVDTVEQFGKFETARQALSAARRLAQA